MEIDFLRFLRKPNRTLRAYQQLRKVYGNPGPWPWFGREAPHSDAEITIGAILTQNTNWNNVEKALANLRRKKASSIKPLYRLGRKNMKSLKKLIRPSGYYNQKAERLHAFTSMIAKDFGTLEKFLRRDTRASRRILLSIKGIGQETADTILLYAGRKPVFVIDAYTRRFAKAKHLSRQLDYQKLQQFFMRNLPLDVALYQDYHALIVRWGKQTAGKQTKFRKKQPKLQ